MYILYDIGKYISITSNYVKNSTKKKEKKLKFQNNVGSSKFIKKYISIDFFIFFFF